MQGHSKQESIAQTIARHLLQFISFASKHRVVCSRRPQVASQKPRSNIMPEIQAVNQKGGAQSIVHDGIHAIRELRRAEGHQGLWHVILVQ